MTQFAISLNTDQTRSILAIRHIYVERVHKSEYHMHFYKDVLNVIAQLPEAVALINHNIYHEILHMTWL